MWGCIVFVGLVQGEVSFDDPNFHRHELTYCSSRNSTPDTFRMLIGLPSLPSLTRSRGLRTGSPSLTTPEAFPTKIVGDPAVLKALIEASAD